MVEDWVYRLKSGDWLKLLERNRAVWFCIRFHAYNVGPIGLDLVQVAAPFNGGVLTLQVVSTEKQFQLAPVGVSDVYSPVPQDDAMLLIASKVLGS